MHFRENPATYNQHCYIHLQCCQTRSYQTLGLGCVQGEKIEVSSKDRLHFVAEDYTIFYIYNAIRTAEFSKERKWLAMINKEEYDKTLIKYKDYFENYRSEVSC